MLVYHLLKPLIISNIDLIVILKCLMKSVLCVASKCFKSAKDYNLALQPLNFLMQMYTYAEQAWSQIHEYLYLAVFKYYF